MTAFTGVSPLRGRLSMAALRQPGEAWKHRRGENGLPGLDERWAAGAWEGGGWLARGRVQAVHGHMTDRKSRQYVRFCGGGGLIRSGDW